MTQKAVKNIIEEWNGGSSNGSVWRSWHSLLGGFFGVILSERSEKYGSFGEANCFSVKCVVIYNSDMIHLMKLSSR